MANWTWQTLPSREDSSVNFTTGTPDGGMLECRFVQRDPDYFIIYLSSHSGCRNACRFCHLTASGQTMYTPATLDDYLAQAERVFAHYDALYRDRPDRPVRVHFNWMARGEPLENPAMLQNATDLFGRLREMARSRGLAPAFKISTILPETLTGSLADGFRDPDLTIYYSLYSLDPAFRRRWLPRAMDAGRGLDLLAAWQRETGGRVALHGAFIAGENDSEAAVRAIGEAVRARGLVAKFNLVRYNPYSETQGRESPPTVLEDRFALLAPYLTAPGSRMVPRVGFDVKASCGMFVTP